MYVYSIQREDMHELKDRGQDITATTEVRTRAALSQKSVRWVAMKFNDNAHVA